jgi:hypothetical protein
MLTILRVLVFYSTGTANKEICLRTHLFISSTRTVENNGNIAKFEEFGFNVFDQQRGASYHPVLPFARAVKLGSPRLGGGGGGCSLLTGCAAVGSIYSLTV